MSELQVGADIDLRVAAEVFGATADHIPEGWPHFTDEDGCQCPKLPDFSTEIAPAMKVVREMGRRGYDFEGGVMSHIGAYASFRDYEAPKGTPADGHASVDPRDVSDYADATGALPLAICRAALAALASTPDSAVPEPSPGDTHGGAS